jgi:nicotinamidase-related amidase
MTYDPTKTALLLVDPYNDFLSERGKAWPRAKSEAMNAAHAINGPTYAHVVTTTDKLIAELAGRAEAGRP